MTDISTQENNTNNEMPADSASLQIQAIANTLVPKILQGVNERLPNLVTNILSQKGFVSAAGYDDESDEEESDKDMGAQNNQIIRDASAQITSNRDAGAQQVSNMDTGAPQRTEIMDADAQSCGKKKDIIPQKLSKTMQMTRIYKTIKVLTMWTNYCNIPATLEENVSIQQ